MRGQGRGPQVGQGGRRRGEGPPVSGACRGQERYHHKVDANRAARARGLPIAAVIPCAGHWHIPT